MLVFMLKIANMAMALTSSTMSDKFKVIEIWLVQMTHTRGDQVLWIPIY